MLEINKIHQGNCLELMKDIPDKSVNLVLCDLPYGTTACKWDSVIPLEKLWYEYNRILKDCGVIVLTASQPFTSVLVMSNPKMFKEELCWLKNKSGSGLLVKQKHLKVHEEILIFAKNGKYTYNPQKWGVEDKQFLTQRKTLSIYGGGNQIYGSMNMNRIPDEGTRNPISILAYRVPHNPSKSKSYSNKFDIRKHPTQKPIKLFDYLVKTYSNEGDLILDNCIGSGTTAESCIKNNRKFIGIEKEEDFVKIAQNRVLSLLPLAENSKEVRHSPHQ
ncbi:MAG: site-specific DNA-methyltransferase [Nanoarchaeota archaeon]|nr:site-specific DNA-methyltransferase [Nanoarchaeota archaeon]